jgi:hypothetical protein
VEFSIMNRFRLATFALLCLVSGGCVEGEVTYTLNPDGTAKVRLEIVTVKMIDPNIGARKKNEEETLDSLLRDAITPILETAGVVAWKDVDASFLPNGKLKFSGTAYIRRVQDFKPMAFPLLASNHAVENGADGSFKLVPKNDFDNSPTPNTNKRKKKTPDEIKKLNDEELDKYILRELIELQSSKSLFVAMFTGAKLKTTYVLPGTPNAVSVFTQDGRRVSATMDGAKVLAALDKLLAQDRAAWRGIYRGATEADVLATLLFEQGSWHGSATLAKPGEAQFDFAKEVRLAREAYPALRKKFGFGEDFKFPTGDDDRPPPKFNDHGPPPKGDDRGPPPKLDPPKPPPGQDDPPKKPQ